MKTPPSPLHSSFLNHKSVIFGVAGPKLLPEEMAFFAETRPLGFILFSRNISDKAQLSSLIADLRTAVKNPYSPIFIDQEGGRVCRLKAPTWYTPPAAAIFGEIANTNLSDAKRALRLSTTLIALDLVELGVSSDAIPVLDVLNNDTHAIIGDRAYSADKLIVTELGRVVCETLEEFKIAPIIKHIPGHGRARADSHLNLPIVNATYEGLLDIDFYPFLKLNDVQLAMTAHILYKSIDPDAPATLSKKVISEIRDTIGFKGILMTDCILMKALPGTIIDKAERALDAGCDIVLHSRGTVEEMKAIAQSIPYIKNYQDAILTKLFVQDKPRALSDRIGIQKELSNLLHTHLDFSTPKHTTDPTEKSD